MNDVYLLLTPLLMLPVVALLGFVGCDKLIGLEPVPSPLPAPTNLLAIAGDGRVDLTWDEYTGATEYYLKRGTVSGHYDVNNPVNSLRVTFADMDVTNGTTYYYVVTARVTNESQNSDEATATPMSTVIPSEYFVTSYTLGTLQQRSTWAGMEILVGANSLDVHAVGRVFAPGNVMQHAIKIVDKATNLDLTTVKLDTVGGTDGQMQTAPVPNQVTLNKNSSYYIISREMVGTDDFYQDDSTVQTTGVATVVNAIRGDRISPYIPSGGPNHCFGPLTFQYTVIP